MAALLVGGVVVAGQDDGHPAQQVQLLPGAAWLPSSRVGQVTLLDGSSVEVAAQLQAAPPGNALDVVQQGATAYVIDQTAGTVRRVDGATFELTSPASPIPDAHAGLTAIPSRNSLYTVDTQRGIVADTDPHTLARRGEMLSLASKLSAGAATVDDNGTLWAVDTATGDLTRVSGGSRTIQRQVAQPGRSILAVANGSPVVLDTAGRKAITIDRDTGRVRDTVDLDVRTNDTFEVSGSPHSDRLYLVVGRGVLTICDLAAVKCDKAIPLDVGNKYGAAVEAGNRLFVPDYTTGQVWIIDLARSQVIAKPTVLTRPGQFQLLSRDSLVFYNDASTEHAGVIHLDGSVAAAAKYNPDNPAKGVTNPNPPPGRQPDAPNPSPDKPKPPQDTPGTPPPSSRPPQPDPQPGTPTGAPRPADPGDPPVNRPDPPGNPGDPPVDRPDPPGNPGGPPEPRLEIAMSEVNPVVDESITLRVTNSSGEAPTSAHWTFGDGAQGDGVTTSHSWTAARPTGYLVAAVVTLPDGRERTVSVTVPVTEKPTVPLTVAVPGGGGTITGGGLNCPGVCTVGVEPGKQVTLTARPDGDHVLGTWSGDACAGSKAATCVVTMDSAKTVSHRFDSPLRTFTLTAIRPSSGSIRSNNPPISCGGIISGACSATVNQGTQIQLTPAPDQNHDFVSWGGACAGQGTTCVLTMTKDETVSATFNRTLPPDITSLTCEFSGNNKFFCDVSHSNGGTVEWIIDNNPAPQFDGQNSISTSCGSRTVTGIKVVITNRVGQDIKTTSVSCQGEPK
ncbi:hypothetical protein [Actinocrispum sp. NPDC049592]|uniref:InlB B-repeat-containing protein n=1 Tax=Actinocrispum sp. NPDC049592 TaxID=3154835 RepID=UPI00341DFF2B